MQETFEIYDKRTILYKVLNLVVLCFLLFVFTCITVPNVIAKAPQGLMVVLFLTGMVITIGGMFIGGSSIKTYVSDGDLTLTDKSITINEDKYLLADLSLVETKAGGYKGRGSRGGLGDGTGNKITIKTNAGDIIEKKFVVTSQQQRDNLAEILKYWRRTGFKIISNGIDLV